eukprot:4763842-Prymnesium_polylepis.1
MCVRISSTLPANLRKSAAAHTNVQHAEHVQLPFEVGLVVARHHPPAQQRRWPFDAHRAPAQYGRLPLLALAPALVHIDVLGAQTVYKLGERRCRRLQHEVDAGEAPARVRTHVQHHGRDHELRRPPLQVSRVSRGVVHCSAGVTTAFECKLQVGEVCSGESRVRAAMGGGSLTVIDVQHHLLQRLRLLPRAAARLRLLHLPLRRLLRDEFLEPHPEVQEALAPVAAGSAGRQLVCQVVKCAAHVRGI